MLFVAALALRFSYQARISIEHWDEAVNASNLFLDGGYPNRFLYSPPLCRRLIEWSMIALGKTPLAAVMPSLVLGSCTIPLCWWVGREWFGPIAGIAAAALAALSDFQIVYSRTALTDAALGFWFLLAVYCSWRALARNHLGEAVVAGLVVACAWATKYNGWLPLAVALSGFIAWGLFERFDRREWFARLPVVATLVVATAIGWSPVWMSLQPDGGYSAVSANHAQYFFGLSGWWDDFKRQIANQRYYEGWLDGGRNDFGLDASRHYSAPASRRLDGQQHCRSRNRNRPKAPGKPAASRGSRADCFARRADGSTS